MPKTATEYANLKASVGEKMPEGFWLGLKVSSDLLDLDL